MRTNEELSNSVVGIWMFLSTKVVLTLSIYEIAKSSRCAKKRRVFFNSGDEVK